MFGAEYLSISPIHINYYTSVLICVLVGIGVGAVFLPIYLKGGKNSPIYAAIPALWLGVFLLNIIAAHMGDSGPENKVGGALIIATACTLMPPRCSLIFGSYINGYMLRKLLMKSINRGLTSRSTGTGNL